MLPAGQRERPEAVAGAKAKAPTKNELLAESSQALLDAEELVSAFEGRALTRVGFRMPGC